MKTAKKPTEMNMGNLGYAGLENEIERLNRNLLSSNKKEQEKLERNLKNVISKEKKIISKEKKVISKLLKK